MQKYNELRKQISTYDVVAESSPTESEGKYTRAFCPKCSDIHMMLNLETGIMYCRDCHFNGDVFSYVATVYNCSQEQAFEMLKDHPSRRRPFTIDPRLEKFKKRVQEDRDDELEAKTSKNAHADKDF